MRTRVALALVRPTVRAVPWPAVSAGALLGLVVVGAAAALVELDAEGWTNVLRLAALAGAVGAAFVLDDPADRTTTAAPAARLLRRTVRVSLLVPLAALWWTVVLLLPGVVDGKPVLDGLPLVGITVEAAALLGVALGAAALGGQTGDGGVAGALAVLAGALLTHLPPRPYRLAVTPDDPAWDSVHDVWAGLVLVAVVAFVAAGRDQGAPAPGRRMTARHR